MIPFIIKTILTYILGEYGDGETLENENKELHLRQERFDDFDKDTIFDIVKTGKLPYNFKTIIHNELLLYIYKIVPKYISCFSNCGNGINGVINIGISDANEYTGFPIFFLKKISWQLPRYICETVKDNIRYNLPISNILKRIKVECIPLNIDLDILDDDAQRYYELFKVKHKAYTKKLKKYIREHKIFLQHHREYTQKLNDMLKVGCKYRKELIEFIKNSENCSDIVIKLLNSDSEIVLDNTNTMNDRNNSDTPFYWITKYRDYMTNKIRETKPIKPIYPSIYHPRQILCNLPLMRYKFLKNNKDVCYYIIKIHLNMEDIDQTVEYKINGKWLKKSRVNCSETNNSPGCLG